MDAQRLRAACLALPGTYEDFPFGEETAVFKVQAFAGTPRARPGRIFALSGLHVTTPLTVSLKCEPQLAVELRRDHREITPAYHLNKEHWNGVDLTGALPDDLVLAMVEDSWDLVVAGMTVRERANLDWGG
ncbi:MAG: MmcQ/YjbR family DNA-binding protein [Propionibacteriales bacterium]|nr:MmcQ/YjbR family DNA-binding protein [Propionibacteriales bacterium]